MQWPALFTLLPHSFCHLRTCFGELVDTERNFATMQLTQYAPTAAATKETQMSDKCRRVLDSLIGLWSHESCYSAPVGALITR